MSKILEHVEQKLQNYFKLMVPSAIRLRSLLYGRQVSSSKTTIQEIKVEKKTKANKIVLHPVKAKNIYYRFKSRSYIDEAIFSYIDKVYIKKISKYIYYRWVVKSMKSPLV
jgi:hypothetical protein